MGREGSKKKINNSFYEDLDGRWYEEMDHPIALLRAENALRNPWIAAHIEAALSGPREILDVGCGGGFLTNFLASRGHSVHGLDLSSRSLQIAKQRDTTQSVQYRLGDATALPYPDQSFDVVCAMDLLEHVEDPRAVIEGCSRVLKPGGLFFFHTFSRNFLSWLIVIKGVDWMVPEAPENMHVYSLFLDPSEVTAYCHEHQLQVQKILGVCPDIFSRSFWKMIFKKQIDSGFKFVFTKSLKIGYSGFAIKN